MDQRVVLLLQQSGDGPKCRVRNVGRVEVLSRDEDSCFVIEHRDGGQYHVLGVGMHDIAIPAGEVKVRRLKGRAPATVYAWS